MSAGRGKGFSLIDTIIAVSIFASVFTALMAFFISSMKADYTSEEVLKGTYYLETIKNQFQANYTYEELKNLCEGTVYITSSQLTDDEIFSGDILKAVQNRSDTDSYVSISVGKEADNDTLKFQMEYKYDGGCISCVFYKGNYKKA